MTEETTTPVAPKKTTMRIGEHVFWLSVIVTASASVLAAMIRIDGNQYLVVMAGILSVLGVNQAMKNGKKE